MGLGRTDVEPSAAATGDPLERAAGNQVECTYYLPLTTYSMVYSLLATHYYLTAHRALLTTD